MTATLTTAPQELAAEGSTGRAWALWGTAAGVLGLVGHVFTMQDIDDAARKAGGEELVAAVTRGGYHAGVVAGFLALGCLLVFAAGLQRWQQRSAPDSLAARVASLGLVASAGAMIVGYGVKGMLAIYLPDGINEGTQSVDQLVTLMAIDDLMPFVAWTGVAVAAAALAVCGLLQKLVPTWLGVVAALAVLAPLAMLVMTGLPGFPGLVDPLFLVVTGIGLAASRRTA